MGLAGTDLSREAATWCGRRARSDERSAFVGLFTNKWLWGSILLAITLQAAVIYIPFLQQAFSTVPLTLGDWLRCIGVASSVLLAA